MTNPDSIDAALARAELPVTPEERERLQRNFPVIQSWREQLRLPETRYAEPGVVFRPKR
jgi:hypothetical protein